jgi:enoyl-CoA hydratase/carnithine racemase
MDGRVTEQESVASSLHGFAAISRRHTSCKPIIAAVNGLAYGGAVELVLNCDIVIASEDATFGLPEVKRGVLASQGGPSRVYFVGFGSLWRLFYFLFLGNFQCGGVRRRWCCASSVFSSIPVAGFSKSGGV